MSQTENSHKNDSKAEYESANQKYFKISLLSYSLMTLSLLTNVFSGIPFIVSLIVLALSSEKGGEVNDFLIQLERDEAVVRVESLLQEQLSVPDKVILSRFTDKRLLLSDDVKNSLDFIVSLPSSLTLAISIRAIRPIKNTPITVYYEVEKNQLGYRKDRRSGKRNFGIDPVRETKRRVSSLYKRHPELFPSFPETIVLFASPVCVVIRKDSPVKTFGEDKYLSLKDIFFVDERQIFPLIEALEREKLSKSKSEAQILK
jgi:hypothetical protein